MKIEFTRNGKWVSAVDGDRKISARMWIRGGKDNQALSIYKKVAEPFLLSLGESIFTMTKEDIEAQLWAAQKAHNRADWKKQEASQLTWWQQKGFVDFKQMSTGVNTLTDIAHDGKTVFVGSCKVPYTARLWDKLKKIRSLSEIPNFRWNYAQMSSFISTFDGGVEKQRQQDLVAQQEKILIEWGNAITKPIIKK